VAETHSPKATKGLLKKEKREEKPSLSQDPRGRWAKDRMMMKRTRQRRRRKTLRLKFPLIKL
jgi:hypothetical protein